VARIYPTALVPATLRELTGRVLVLVSSILILPLAGIGRLQSGFPEPGDQFDLHCDVEGQFRETDGTASVTSCVAEDIHQQVGASIDHSGSLIESWCDIDHPEDLYDASDAVKIAEIGSQGGEDGQRSHSRRMPSLFDGKVPPELSADDVVAVYGTVTGDIHNTVVNYTSEVAARGSEDRGKRDAEFLESLIDHG